jgi:hypothetical protein
VPSAPLSDADKDRLNRLDSEMAADPSEMAWRDWVENAVQSDTYFGRPDLTR